MKTTPDPTDAPLVIPPKPPQAQPAQVWKPTQTPGVERNQDGQLRTNAPTPPFVAVADALLSMRPRK